MRNKTAHFTGIKGVGMTPLRPPQADFEGRGRCVHFTGIKGVGMTALSLAMQDKGWVVQGSDTKEPQITDDVLRARGIRVSERFTPRNISKIEKSRWIPIIDRLIYTGAHHGVHNVEAKWAISRNIPISNYARALGELFADKKQICVCGVGGKTTTTAMIATILNDAGLDPSWIIGTSEIPSLPAPGHFGTGEWAVVESDEYVADPASDQTPKFLFLKPRIIICTNIHHDHPDVYPSINETVAAYEQFFHRLPSDGLLLLSSQAADTLERHGQIFRKTAGDRLPFFVKVFDDAGDSSGIAEVRKTLSIPGEYNVKNALAALTVAERLGISRDQALVAISTFRGSKRRFEHIASVAGVDIYDDYAHHPHEISVLFQAVKAAFPRRRIRFIFQPHTYSRTKALFDEFVDSLRAVDEVVMVPIFASAREESDPSVSSEMLTDAICERGGHARFVATKKKLVEYVCQSSRPGDVIMTVGAGNLYDIHDDLVSCLSQSRKTPSKG